MRLADSAPFFAAPHRVMFFAGAVQALLAMLLWAVDIGGRWGGLWPAPAWPWPPAWLHALLMIYGVFPFFMFGFTMTAGPRWQGAGELAAGDYLPAFLLMGGGWLAFYAALAFAPSLLAAALGLVLAGWLLGLRAMLGVALHPAGERDHIVIVVAALCAGAAGLGLFLAFAAGGPPSLPRAAIELGVWGFLLPIFFAVAHRMLPFFTAAALPGYASYRPPWALRLVVGAAAAHLFLAVLGLAAWLWLADAPAGAVLLFLSWRWRLGASLAVRMVAVLHIGCAWIGFAVTLYALQSLLLLSGRPALGLAPLHALGIGACASLLLGMVSRVSLGHAGRPIAADRVIWTGFWTLQAAAALRMLAEILPLSGPWNPAFIAALLWLAAWSAWALRFAPAYFRRRADGKPG